MIITVCFCFCLSLLARTASADGNNYSDAAPITSGQFFKELKTVSLTLTADPWFKKYFTENALRAYVVKNLQRFGIRVRSDAPVALVVSMEELPATIHETTTWTNGSVTAEDYRTHLCNYSLSFNVRATALRGDKYHRVTAGATTASYVFTIEENNSTRDLIFGDQSKENLTFRLDNLIPQALDEIAARSSEDKSPWAATAWTERQKSAGNEAYLQYTNSQPDVERNPILGLDAIPDLQLSSEIKAGDCKEDPSWKKLWQAEFPQFGWTRSQDPPPITLFHGFACLPAQPNQFAFPSYYRLSDEITLVEPNLVFELNGRLVRKPCVIAQADRIKIATKADLEPLFQSYIPRSILEFSTNLKLLNQAAPSAKPVASAPAKEIAIDLGNGVKMDFVPIPAGDFLMGSEKAASQNAVPVHKVTISKPFYMAKYKVTQEQWAAIMGTSPSKFKGAKNPVEQVSWDDCLAFVDKLQAKLDDTKTALLPTEAQWEYGCRAGSTTDFSFGDDPAMLGDYAWFDGNSAGGTHPVGEKKPNAWGLYDMHGNVREWCMDWYADSYPPGAATDPKGPDNGPGRVTRGGPWFEGPAESRTANRYRQPPDTRRQDFGFRVVLNSR